MSKPAIHVVDLHKDFGEVYAVKGVSFDVSQGEIFSLLGPNGAGKSTTISILSCLQEPTRGEASIMGHSIHSDPMGVKKAIGVVPQEIALYPDLSARENLNFWGKMYGLRGAHLAERADAVLEMVGLADRQKSRVDTFSGGMQRRLNIALALMHRPDVVIMDEPTVGIDPQSRRHILDNVKHFNQDGMTVVYTTHYMEEAQELSDHIAIMDGGEIIAYGTNEELVKLVGEQDRIDLTIDFHSDEIFERWKAVNGVHRVSSEDGTYCLLVEDSNLVLPRLFDTANEINIRITSVEIQEPNLEAVFLHLTGRTLRD
ncbi:MAG: ABC transporter ATP-binding protein [Anaerolineales bacterium]|jgi:ABC-2 type transport system ATP-binding protein